MDAAIDEARQGLGLALPGAWGPSGVAGARQARVVPE